MNKPKTGILHYSAPPVVGGVENVIAAHVNLLVMRGYPVGVIAGQGEEAYFPQGVDLQLIPELDSQHPEIIEMNKSLEVGRLPSGFEEMTARITETLKPNLERYDRCFVHNVFTKHFNLPLTAALFRLLERGTIKNCIAWCHDFTWSSPSSGSKVYDRYPWDLLKTYRRDVNYVVVSERRKRTLADLLGCPLEEIKVVYNGVDPKETLGLTEAGYRLIRRLGMLDSDLNMLMPVRVTHAKNIELALKVVAALKEKNTPPKLVLTGPPDPHDAENMKYFDSLKALRHELGVDREVHFVFESGPDPDKPFFIEMKTVGDLFRVSDLMFMPSHREGFGMPVLEAGLVGIPVVSTPVPAAEEIGGENVKIIDAEADPAEIAALILEWVDADKIYHLRRQVRQQYTWDAIFEKDIVPLLMKREA